MTNVEPRKRARHSRRLLSLENPVFDRAREMERRRQVAEGLRGILTVLNSNRSLEQILDYIVGEARRLLGADAAAIYRLLPEKTLSIQSAQGLNDEYVARSDIPLGRSVTGRAALTRRPVALADTGQLLFETQQGFDPAQLELIQELARQFRSVLSVPLVIKDELVGALTLYYASRRNFDQEAIDLAVAFCDQSALAIENARLREQSKEEAITAERSRLARDLHDSVTQMLFSASLVAEVLPSVWNRSQAEGELALGELRQLTRGALAEMRSLLLELRPDQLQNARLENLLRQLAEVVSCRTHTPITANIGGPFDLPASVRLALYRIAQESLNNITKHSGATQIEISLAASQPDGAGQPGVVLSILDNGCGFDPQQVTGDHLGLAIMRERAASVGAQIEITSQHQTGAGTLVKVYWIEPVEEVRGNER